MTPEYYSDILTQAGLKPTSVRILVYRTATAMRGTFSLADMERALPEADRSSLFRTLVALAAHHLLHTLDDGSGSQKYCVCANHGECRDDEFHPHFFCERCHRTLCLKDEGIPRVALPEGFVAREVTYLVKGLCADCAAGSRHKETPHT